MLADYISADRSAMMREMRKMREEDLISTEGRRRDAALVFCKYFS